MKYFTNSVTKYITEQVDSALYGEGGKELRIFTQSLPPSVAFAIFEGVQNHINAREPGIRCITKVATGLAKHWREVKAYPDSEIDRLTQRDWIDTEDRLTYYRNLTSTADDKLLLVLLIGVDHATDRGGLADFDTLTEDVIFRECMAGNYESWVNDLFGYLNLADTDGSGTRDFDSFFSRLFKLHPRNLLALSEFLEATLEPRAKSCDTPSDVLALAFENLPYWSLPPIFSPMNPVKRIEKMDIASRIFSHDRYKEASERKKASVQIKKARDELSTAPQVQGKEPYQDITEFLETLSDFIESGSKASRLRLLYTDFSPIIEILGKQPKKRSKKVEVKKLKGPGFQVFLEAIFEALQEYTSKCGREWAPQHIQDIQVHLESFEFDGTEEDTSSASDTAELVFKGLVGGLDQFLGELSIAVKSERDTVEDDQKDIPIGCHFGREDKDINIISKKLKESRLRFRVQIRAETEVLSVDNDYVWVIPPHHEERVRLTCARVVSEAMMENGIQLPVLHLGETIDELFFAVDDSEAQRLISSGLANPSVKDVLAGLNQSELEPELTKVLVDLSVTYKRFIDSMTGDGYFASLEAPLRELVKKYRQAIDTVLKAHSEHKPSADQLLRRLYQAFLCVADGTSPTSPFLPAAVATGITPAIAETVQAREVFLRDGFQQVCRLMLEGGIRPGKTAFDRLTGLVELRRPLYGLVYDASGRLTTNLRPFGLVHRLGERPAVAPTLAAQAEMRTNDSGEGKSLSEYLRITPESKVIHQTLVAYREVHPYAFDRLAILAANVEDLRPLISGIDAFLTEELKEQDSSNPTPYLLSLKIIGRGPSATRAQEILTSWQERWGETENSRQRACRLVVSFRPAHNRDGVLALLNQIDVGNDVAFLLNFLNDQTGADKVVPTVPFEHDWNAGNIGKFPISEHPRPPNQTDPHLRQGLVSNRRFVVAARHAEMTARLMNPDHPGDHHLIFNQVEYGHLEREMTRAIHRVSRWVACIDRFVDKSLIIDWESSESDERKLVGFTSGVGAYGELNLTLSTERGTTGALKKGTAKRLGQIFREWSDKACERTAHKLVEGAQQITGLSLVRALSNEGTLRDVIGYAIANHLYLSHSNAQFCAAIPLDSFRHWFEGADEGYVPDLLLLEAHLTDNGFSIDAMIVECKVGQKSPTHVEKSIAQASAGLKHLSQLFIPNGDADLSSVFDRRYWWAQLHRALVVRNSKPIKDSEKKAIDFALERLSEGYFDINWRAVGATFWTDDNVPPSMHHMRTIARLPRALCESLDVFHVEVGHEAILASLENPAINYLAKIRPSHGTALVSKPLGQSKNGHEGEPVVDATPTDTPISDSVPLNENQPEATPATELIESSHEDEFNRQPAEENGAFQHPDVSNSASLNPSEEPNIREFSVPRVPERILLGEEITMQSGGGQPIYWEYGHPELPNRHLLLFGGSGAGKTYAIQALLMEMAMSGQPSLVIDYTDGFLPQQLEPKLLEIAKPDMFALAAGKKLPLDPFRPQSEEIEGIGRIEDSAFDVAKRVASIFIAVYSSLGEQQRATLVQVIEEGVEAGNFSLEALHEFLKEMGDDTLANKIMPLARTKPFENVEMDTWKDLFDGKDSQLSILQLTRIASDVQRLIIEFVLWDLWDYMRRTGSRTRPLPVVLDEVQNLDHRSGSPLEKYLREGRKFGASMILATQTLSNFGRDERDRLFQASHKLFFAPASTELRSFAAILKDTMPNTTVDDWANKLNSLKKGECLSVGFERKPDGSLRPTVRKVSITALEDRRGEMSE